MVMAIDLAVSLGEALLKLLDGLNLKSIVKLFLEKGREWYQMFVGWFWTVDLDRYENLVHKVVPVMSSMDDDFIALEKRMTENSSEPASLEDCLELAPHAELQDQVLPGLGVSYVEATEENMKGDSGAFDMEKIKALRKERRKIKSGHIMQAAKVLAKTGRLSHDIMTATHLDRQAVIMTLRRECQRVNLNTRDTDILVHAATWQVMTPSQNVVDSVSLTWNPSSEAIRKHCRNLMSFGGQAKSTHNKERLN